MARQRCTYDDLCHLSGSVEKSQIRFSLESLERLEVMLIREITRDGGRLFRCESLTDVAVDGVA